MAGIACGDAPHPHRHLCGLVALALAARSAGPATIPFSGRIGRRALAPGRYELRLTATDAAGNRSRATTLRFAIVRG